MDCASPPAAARPSTLPQWVPFIFLCVVPIQTHCKESSTDLVPPTGRQYSGTLSFTYTVCLFLCGHSLSKLYSLLLFQNCQSLNFSLFSCLLSLSHSWVLHPTPSPTPTLSPSPKKMSVSLTTDIQQEGERGPLIEPCSRGKTSPQPQGTKEGTGEGLEPEDSSPQDAQVGRSGNKPYVYCWSIIMCTCFSLPHFIWLRLPYFNCLRDYRLNCNKCTPFFSPSGICV